MTKVLTRKTNHFASDMHKDANNANAVCRTFWLKLCALSAGTVTVTILAKAPALVTVTGCHSQSQ